MRKVQTVLKAMKFNFKGSSFDPARDLEADSDFMSFLELPETEQGLMGKFMAQVVSLPYVDLAALALFMNDPANDDAVEAALRGTRPISELTDLMRKTDD